MLKTKTIDENNEYWYGLISENLKTLGAVRPELMMSIYSEYRLEDCYLVLILTFKGLLRAV